MSHEKGSVLVWHGSNIIVRTSSELLENFVLVWFWFYADYRNQSIETQKKTWDTVIVSQILMMEAWEVCQAVKDQFDDGKKLTNCLKVFLILMFHHLSSSSMSLSWNTLYTSCIHSLMSLLSSVMRDGGTSNTPRITRAKSRKLNT